jgi:CheY-like chemotaxis protein
MGNIGKNSILVVDDETMNLEFLRGILSPDYTLYMTKNGASALEMADKYTPDLILLDIIMPGMDGFEVLQSLKTSEKTRDIPVIIITGLDNDENEEKGLKLEAADFIRKPFNAKMVTARVRHHLQRTKNIHKALVVDDMDVLLFIIKEQLLRYGLQVDTASNGLDAVEKAKNNVYDLVFMDHLMPEMDGVEAAGEIRKLKKELPIIALTSNMDSGAEAKYLAAGFNGFLCKPVGKQELEGTLKKWLPGVVLLN